MKEKVKGIIKNLSILLVISLVIWAFIAYVGFTSQMQYLESTDYNVVIYENGDAKITETWDIRVNDTNTLFKEFKLDSSKYSGITDVEVGEITEDGYKPFEQIDEEMYHVTKGCYYGLEKKRNHFEIAWGIGMDRKMGRRKYQISYVVKDAITDYLDCQEFYWEFLAKDIGNIPSRKNTGTITFPENVKNLENLRVWGHGQLNGEIKKVSNNQVKFNLDNLSQMSRLEVRIVTEEKMFNNISDNKIRNYNGLPSILREENLWANDANEERIKHDNTRNVALIIYIIIIVFYAIKILKVKIYENKEEVKTKRVTYFRDIPRGDDSTPTEAAYLYKFNKSRLNTKEVQQNAVSATILDLCLRKKIALRTDNNKNVYIKIIDKADGLKADEIQIYRLLKSAGGDSEFEVGDLKDYAKENYNLYSNRINNLVNCARNNLYKLKLIDKSKEKAYKRFNNAEMKSSFLFNLYSFTLITMLFCIIPFFRLMMELMVGIGNAEIFLKFLIIILPIVGELLYYFKAQKSARNKIAILTQKGSEEKAQWKGLVNYMNNFSNFKEKVVPDLILWEKYLVYATALGIADRVVAQMKASYPEVFVKEYWEKEDVKNQHPILDFTMSPYYSKSRLISSPIVRIEKGIINAYATSQREISRHMSSSRRKWLLKWKRRRRRLLKWRRRPVAVGRTHWRQIKNSLIGS